MTTPQGAATFTGLAEAGPDIVTQKQVVIPTGMVSDALLVARANPDEFRRTQQAWACDHVGQVAVAIEGFFVDTLESHDSPTADAVLMGSVLAAAVLKALDKSGVSSLEDYRNNLLTWGIPPRIIRYDGQDFPAEQARTLLGPDAVSELGEVRSPASRSACVTLLGFTLYHSPRHNSAQSGV